MKTLSKLKIEGFRGICNLEIEELTQVNLIVGDNNCGKTSMLEALQLLRSGSAANLFNIARLRDRGALSFTNSLYDNFICMFPKRIWQSSCVLYCCRHRNKRTFGLKRA